MKNKHFLRNWIILIAVLGSIGFFGLKSYWKTQLDPVNPKDTTPKAFVVRKGEATTDIIQDLEDKGLIKSKLAFSQLLKQSGQEDQIQAGDYKLSPSMSSQDVMKVLLSGTEDRWVTLLEGWRVEEMAEKIHQELGIDQKEFLKYAKEGYMFPDTYLFNKEATAQTVASTLKNTFDDRYTDEIQSQIKKRGLTPEQGVILASIVEREARSDQVRTNVAGILLKRFKIGMGLNVDAAIQYALGYQSSEHSWWKRNLSLDDLKVTSPYNTYIHAGLPPTPICNPSLSSLKAVANADSSTPYLYYYHDAKGNTYYAKTLDEHNQNVASHP